MMLVYKSGKTTKKETMKKSIFLLSLVASLALSSCNGGSTEATTAVDSTSVAVDTTAVADSSSVATDSTKADTTVKK